MVTPLTLKYNTICGACQRVPNVPNHTYELVHPKIGTNTSAKHIGPSVQGLFKVHAAKCATLWIILLRSSYWQVSSIAKISNK